MVDSPEIRELDGMKLVGMHRSMTFGDPSLRALWRMFRSRVGEVGNRASEDFISMRIFERPPALAPTPGSRFEQWAAVEVSALEGVPPGMDVHEIRGGTYAVFKYRGLADGFARAARSIYGEWLPASGFALADREYFEVLGPSYRPDDPDATEEVWIPVCPRGDVAGGEA